MKMIDWDVLIGAENNIDDAKFSCNSGARPSALNDNSEKVGRLKSSSHEGLMNSAPLAPLAPLKNKGEGIEQENNSHAEGGASDNYCATETHPVNPIAVTLLLTCCNKATFSKEETIEAILNLQTIPQPEQIRSWAILCQTHGIDPHRVIYSFTKSSNQGTSCQGCKHLEMDLISMEGKRRVFRFVCKQRHHLLEAFYIHERELIAPESCGDYLPTA